MPVYNLPLIVIFAVAAVSFELPLCSACWAR
jgi:hypothetical protein